MCPDRGIKELKEGKEKQGRRGKRRERDNMARCSNSAFFKIIKPDTDDRL